MGLIAGCATAALALTGPPGAVASGKLFQFKGVHACASSLPGQGCATSRALDGASSVAVSSDGRSVYVASSQADSIATFIRDRSDGRVVQGRGLNGCITATGLDGCNTGIGLRGAFAVAVSPDDRNVYAVSNSAVAVLNRSNQGSLSQPIGVNGCVGEFPSEGCAQGRALIAGSDIAVSPDGRHVYTAAAGSDAVAAFARNPGGTLTQLVGTDGCVNRDGSDGCATGRALNGPQAIAISPSGEHVYVTSHWSNAVAVFSRDPVSGALAQLPDGAGCASLTGEEGCRKVRHVEQPNGIALAPDGEDLHVASSGSGSVTTFAIADNGSLDQLDGARGCIGEAALSGCADRSSLADVRDVTVSTDGRFVYAAGSAAATSLRRARSGALAAIGCVSVDGRHGCRDGLGLVNGASIAAGPGGRQAYVATDGSDSLAVLARRGHVTARIRGVPRRCARGDFVAKVRAKSTLALRRAKVFRDGRGPDVQSLKRSSRLRVEIDSRRLRRRGRHTLTVRVYDVSGASDRARATFRRC